MKDKNIAEIKIWSKSTDRGISSNEMWVPVAPLSCYTLFVINDNIQILILRQKGKMTILTQFNFLTWSSYTSISVIEVSKKGELVVNRQL